MTGENPAVLCVGHANVDEVLHLDDKLREEKSAKTKSEERAGGGATNTSLILSNSDNIGDVYLCASVGSDDRGSKLVNVLEDNEVNLVLDRTDEANTTKIRAFIMDGSKPHYAHEDQGLHTFTPDDVDDSVWEDISHMHITSFHPEMTKKFVEYAKDYDATVSFNPTQGYFENSYEDVVELVDLVQMNRQESETFRDRNGPLGYVVDELNTDVVITHGPAGCTMHSKDGVVSHSGYPDYVDEVVDTIGAGDTFMSGLLTQWVNGSDSRDCIRYANAYGAVSVTHLGAPNSINTDDVYDIVN